MTPLVDAVYRVLIVEDSAEDRETYRRYLSQSRSPTFEFSEAETIEGGLERFAESVPACVLLDYRLPDGDGLDFLERVGSEFPPHEVHVVMLTQYGDEEVVTDAMKKGAMDYISKERLSQDTLCRAVNEVIAKGSLLRELHERELEKNRLIDELRQALDQVKTLRGIVPICANCKNIRDDAGFWHQVEVYVRDHTEAQFSHGICPECEKKLYPETTPDRRP